MPNQFKIDQVEKSTSRLKEASGIYFASYTGMNVIQATEFRKLCRETNVDYSITKNTLINTADSCIIFNEKKHWYKATKKSNDKWNTQISLQLSIINQEFLCFSIYEGNKETVNTDK